MTLRDQVRAAIEAAMERNDDPERDDVDVAADRVMDVVAPLISGAGAWMNALTPGFHVGPGGSEYRRCPACGATAVRLDDIRHGPNCEYIKIRTALGIRA